MPDKLNNVVYLYQTSEKKHNVRYDNPDSDSLRSIYVMKTGLPTPYPRSIKVTIEQNEEED